MGASHEGTGEQMEEERDLGTCRCGRPAQKISSGRPECWPCWYRRKLDLPAAEHWAKVAEAFLSNVDLYDLTEYLPKCGVSKTIRPSTGESDIHTMLFAAQAILEYSKKIVEEGVTVPLTEEEAVDA